MRFSTAIISAGLMAALALPAAANAAATWRAAPHAIPNGLSVPHRPASAGSSVLSKATTASKPKANVKPRKTKPRPDLLKGQVILPFVQLPASESGLGYVENCASYLGCTDEEYCEVWGDRCDVVDAPVGTRTRSSHGSGSTW
jgi:hypothetical protein